MHCGRKAYARSVNQAEPSAPLLSRPVTPVPEPAPLRLQYETKLSFLVTFKGEKRLHQGFTDYSLWYNKDELMAHGHKPSPSN
jgi:hypothetical protein